MIDDTDRRGYQPGGGLVPIPDPSLLTTEALQREIRGLKELNAVQLEAVKERINEVSNYSRQRGADIEAAIKVLQHLLEEKINRNADVSNEKFSAINTQFALNETALQAAFLAQKELGDERSKSSALAISKSDTTFNEALKQLSIISGTENKALKEQIDDLKESNSLLRGAHSGAKDFWGYVIGGIGGAVGVGTLIVLIMTRIH
jgi:hypothetical protein